MQGRAAWVQGSGVCSVDAAAGALCCRAVRALTRAMPRHLLHLLKLCIKAAVVVGIFWQAVRCICCLLPACSPAPPACLPAGNHEAAAPATLEAVRRGVPGAVLERAKQLCAADKLHRAISELQAAIKRCDAPRSVVPHAARMPACCQAAPPAGLWCGCHCCMGSSEPCVFGPA